jgi:hypothetical protein
MALLASHDSHAPGMTAFSLMVAVLSSVLGKVQPAVLLRAPSRLAMRF